MVKKIKSILFVLGAISTMLILSSQSSEAQEAATKASYKCTPCGCTKDNVIVHKPGNCTACGMQLINVDNPDEGLNYKNLTAVQVCELIAANPEIFIIDVRSAGEFEQRTSQIGRFKNAVNIPVTEVEKRIKELEVYKNKEVLVYCSISARSPMASKILADKGFSKIFNLMGGLIAWNEAELSELPCRDSLTQKN